MENTKQAIEQAAYVVQKAIDRLAGKVEADNELVAQVDDIAERTDGLTAKKTVYSGTNVSSVTFTIPDKHYAIVMYSGHMSSIVNSATSHTTLYTGGDSFSDAGFTLSKDGDDFTLTRNNNAAFLYAIIIL